jgi:hypothetical protein
MIRIIEKHLHECEYEEERIINTANRIITTVNTINDFCMLMKRTLDGYSRFIGATRLHSFQISNQPIVDDLVTCHNRYIYFILNDIHVVCDIVYK